MYKKKKFSANGSKVNIRKMNKNLLESLKNLVLPPNFIAKKLQ
jgi:hypothetical protein